MQRPGARDNAFEGPLRAELLAIRARIDTLVDSLAGRDASQGTSHAAMLRGALSVLNDPTNDDRMAQSAHSMRELLEKLPKQYNGAPVHARTKDLKDHLGTIGRPFDRLRRYAAERGVDILAPDIPEPIRNAVISAVEAVEHSRANELSRSKRREQFLRSVDAIGTLAPTAGPDPRLDEWARLESKFQGVSHHDIEMTEAEYVALLIEAIEFLARILAPPTAQTVSLLDDIVREGERNG